jgi:hypothetical protein
LQQDAQDGYRELIAKYPGTAAADEARQLLGLPKQSAADPPPISPPASSGATGPGRQTTVPPR